MMPSNLPSLVPVRLVDTAPPIDIAQLLDGGLSATVRSLCRMINIARNMQIARIRQNPALAQGLLTILVNTPGGPQQVDVLLDWAIPIWAAGLQTSRLPKEKRALALIVQQEAVNAIRRAFTGSEQAPPARPSETPVDAMSKIRQGISLLVENLEIKQAIALLVDGVSMLEVERQKEQAQIAELTRNQRTLTGRVTVVEEWLMSLDRRVAKISQSSAHEPESQPALSEAHLVDLRTLFRLLEQATGRTQAQLEQELIDTFRVAAINAIPDEQWQDVLAWCWWRAQQLQ